MSPWTKLFPTNRTKHEIINDLEAVATVTDTTPFDAAMSIGRDFNIVLAVQEHAPPRLKEIERLVVDHTRQIEKLRAEAVQLKRLLTAVRSPKPKGKKVSPSN